MKYSGIIYTQEKENKVVAEQVCNTEELIIHNL
jgi:hypothetical protein